MPARQLQIAEAQLALARAAEGHRAVDMKLASLVLALDHLQKPAWRGSLGSGRAFRRIDQLQLDGAQAQAITVAQLKACTDALVVDPGGALTGIAQVVVAVILADLGVEAGDSGIAKHQLVTAVLTDGQAFVGQPDRRLAVIQELQSEHRGRLGSVE